ncbi:MAG: hypothetical protein ACRCVT_02635 [Leadbetterella sp.]
MNTIKTLVFIPLFFAINTYCQKTTIALGAFTEVEFLYNGKNAKSIYCNGIEVGKLEFDKKKCIFQNQDGQYTLNLDPSNSDTYTLKDKQNLIIGSTKRYYKEHVIGFNGNYYTIKRENFSNKYTLKELYNKHLNDFDPPRLLVLNMDKKKVKIQHNVTEIPVHLLPILFN